MPITARDSTIYTPGDYFRGLRADAALHNLYGRDDSGHYKTLAETLNFIAPARTFILESPIGENANDGGYSLYIDRHDWGELVNKAEHSLKILPENFRVNSVWRRILNFADQWYTGESLCKDLAEGLWFEFDVSGPPPGLPVPSVFFGVENNSVDNSVTAILKGLAAFNYDLPSVQRDLLVTCLRTMGPLCSSFQVGLMLSRPASPLRLCAFNGKLSEVLTGLKDLGITTLEDYPDFQQEFLHLAPRFLAVDLDIGTVFGPKVGIELKYTPVNTVREQRENPSGPALLELLVDKKWCLPNKSQAILNWPGGSKYHPDPDDFWSPRKIILRVISHIKIDFQPGRPPRAKVYLTYGS
jgi:hypothetical protein